ncbi:hypothetical protein [Mesorhizobium sp.]|uniref:hypothetical protein n=1 Tax=Mesorhizobium sp. TaxID=1871066 RepID=UPI000FE5FBD7|nr:hypothetical protein [Mesorhizobium sp.]RWD43811.1 MAG: hypothetical protein EOS35_19385 [Mesorhizobium sp.]TIS76927.1 MAG: hypothetical protein E5W94_15695 [Mesorhizobium sp.]
MPRHAADDADHGPAGRRALLRGFGSAIIRVFENFLTLYRTDTVSVAKRQEICGQESGRHPRTRRLPGSDVVPG